MEDTPPTAPDPPRSETGQQDRAPTPFPISQFPNGETDVFAPPPPEFASALAAARSAQASGLEAIAALVEPMRAACPTLAKILASAGVRTSLDGYERQDAESVRQQTLLKRESFRASLCLLAAGVMSGLILAVSAGALASLVDNAMKDWLILGLGLVTLALGAFAAYFSYIARDQGRIARWRTCRGEAEAARLSAFSRVAAAASIMGKDVALFGLAVVAVHLLDDQRDWLSARARRHRESSEGTSRMGAVASALAFIGGSGAVIASQTGGGAAVWIVFAGVIGSAIGAFAANREALNQDRANAERYDKTRTAMDAVAARVDSIAATIAGGRPEALNAFTKTLADLLDAENKQWLDGTAQANAAIATLDEQLGQLGKDRGAGRPAAS